jgi:spore coat protein U-like protein
MKTTRTALFILVGTLAMAPAAIAGTDTDNLTVTASVQNTCVITGGTLAFGVYDTVSGAAVDASTALSVECTRGAATTITLGEGDNADVASAPDEPLRRLSDGDTSFLSYSLFSDVGRTAIWGDTAGTGKDYNAVSAAPVSQTVYGRLASNQDVVAGSYTDTVIATISF